MTKDNRDRPSVNGKKCGRPPKLDKKVEEDLIAENQRLRMENEYLKKLNALVQERIERDSGKNQKLLDLIRKFMYNILSKNNLS